VLSGLFNHLRGCRGLKPPARELFMDLYYDLPAFNQCEMGARILRRQDFLIEVSAFFIIF